jgi:hypothetical protein
VIALPQGVSRALAALELIVSAETHLGPLRLSPPEQEQDRLRFSIGEKA